MQFISPLYSFLFFLIPILIYWHVFFQSKYQVSIKYSFNYLIPKEVSKKSKRYVDIIFLLKLIIIFLLIFSLSRPVLIDERMSEKINVIDIILVIDQSSSMLAQDFKPNRLEAVKDVAKEFIFDRLGDRLGIILFAGKSYIQCPLTYDIDILSEFVDQIEIVEKDYDGTAIGMAITNMINRLRKSKSKSKVAILLSDGSNNSGEIDPLTAAQLAKKFDIKIYTIGVGKGGLVPYPFKDAFGKTFIRNAQVDIDEKVLKEIALETGGDYFKAKDKSSLQMIYSEINRLERTEIDYNNKINYKDIFYFGTIPSIILYMLMLIYRRIFLEVL